ncbi:helicase-related protein [Geodermatophilus sp. CPCC 206100]|uniref:helicase-related protein n=1 Tax=Geodermatophilus sp. CPCC 206100 TaxID=3020054 RepID=UPI003B00F89D
MNPDHLQYLDYGQLHEGRLRQHQADGVAFMMATPKTMCADPVGAGKTVQAAGVIAHLVEAGVVDPSRPVLWLTSDSQLAHQTTVELRRFLPGLTVRCLAGRRDLDSRANEDVRRLALNTPAHVKVMTFSQWLARHTLWEGPRPVVILDEVSQLKGGGKQHAAVLQATSTAERVHAFTATLYENSPMDVWHVYALLHLPHLPGWAAFAQQYVQWQVFDNGRRPTGWLNPGAAAAFRDLTAGHYFRRAEALADLLRPEYVRHDEWVPPSNTQASQLRWADTHIKDPLARQQRHRAVVTGQPGGLSTRAKHAAYLINRLATADPMTKVLLIAESLDELDAIANDLKELRIGYVELRGSTGKGDRPGLVEEFRDDPNMHVLLGSKVVERGLNLQFAGHLVSVGVPDNPARLQQQIGRIVRHGSPFAEAHHWVVLSDCDLDRSALKRVERKEAEAALLTTS